jgi:hypothetical protein
MTNYEELDQSKVFSKMEKQFFKSDNINRYDALPKEGLRIVEDKLTDFRDYATKLNFDNYKYENMLCEMREVLSNFYWILNVHTSNRLLESDEETGEALDVQGKPQKLWRLYHSDTFSYGSKLWGNCQNPEDLYDSPVEQGFDCDTPGLDEYTSKYLEKKWMCHPYINWAIINAYLLHAGRIQITEYDEQYSLADLSALFYLNTLETSSVVGTVFEKVLVSESNYNIFVAKVKKVYPIATIKLISVIVVITALIKYFTDYQKTANVLLCIGLFISIYDLIFSRKNNNKKLHEIDKMRNLLVALKDAWVSANSPAVDLIRIKDKVAAAEKMGYRFPQPFHALLTDTISKYGNTLSVKSWVSY